MYKASGELRCRMSKDDTMGSEKRGEARQIAESWWIVLGSAD